MPEHSLLDIVGLCDNLHIRRQPPVASPFNDEELIPLCLHASPGSPVIGLLRPLVIQKLIEENLRAEEQNKPQLWDLRLNLHSPFVHRTDGGLGALSASVGFNDSLDTHEKRTAAMKELCERWRDTGVFAEQCGPKKWRDEMYPVYKNPFGVHDHPSSSPAGQYLETLNYAFEMERSACSVFGIVTYGVHMSIFEEISDGGKPQSIRVWVPTRAKTKQTWPGYLDNTVAGGIPSGMSAFKTLVKESMEEASISETIIRQHAKSVGAISYLHRNDAGWLQPEIEYLYDICIPHGADPEPFTPRPLDGEVECFEYLDQVELLKRLRAGLFKANCGVAIIELLIRRGYVTPDNEPDFMKILTRIHGNFDYDRW